MAYELKKSGNVCSSCFLIQLSLLRVLTTYLPYWLAPSYLFQILQHSRPLLLFSHLYTGKEPKYLKKKKNSTCNTFQKEAIIFFSFLLSIKNKILLERLKISKWNLYLSNIEFLLFINGFSVFSYCYRDKSTLWLTPGSTIHIEYNENGCLHVWAVLIPTLQINLGFNFQKFLFWIVYEIEGILFCNVNPLLKWIPSQYLWVIKLYLV